ncbi:MAG: 50S ribosomal protein L5 [Chloroflexi bacterium]|nr:50S ribosomal protein L5 [Chloroflexota bacterium]
MQRDDRLGEPAGEARPAAEGAAESKPRPARRPRAAPAPAGPAAGEAEKPKAEGEGKAQAQAQPRPARGPRRKEAAPPPPSEPQPEPQVKPRVPPRLLKRYREEAVPALMRDFNYRNPMAVPRLQKLVLNIGLGEAISNPKAMEAATRDLSLIAGQQPVQRRARRSIAGFKLRAGEPVGIAVTLRGDRMYLFLDKLFNAVLPRIRDFRGVSRSAFDGRGNFSLGIREQVIFPEIDYNQIDKIRGLQVNIAIRARSDREALRLLELLGCPFAKEQAPAAAN